MGRLLMAVAICSFHITIVELIYPLVIPNWARFEIMVGQPGQWRSNLEALQLAKSIQWIALPLISAEWGVQRVLPRQIVISVHFSIMLYQNRLALNPDIPRIILCCQAHPC